MKQAQLDLLRSIAAGLSRGSDEMLRVSPTDAMHPPSCALAIRDAADEIERLRADLAIQHGCCDGAAAQDAHVRQEREEHRAEVERLREALGWMLALHDDLQPSYDKASTIAAARRVHGGER
jgi:hypothetical protein